MEESLGLGFSGGGGSAVPNTGTPAFVSAAARDTHDVHDISHFAATSTQAHNGVAATAGLGRMASMQQPPAPPPLFAAPPPHPTALQRTTTYQYSQPTHQHPQTMQSQPSALPAPYYQQMAHPPPHVPAPPSMQPPTIPIVAVPQQHAPSFQPPPGLPPGAAAPYFPPPPSNVVPPTPIQPSTVPATTSQFTSQFTQQPVEQSQPQQPKDDPIEKARAIALRLHQESTRGGIVDDTTIDSSIDYAQKRRDHFEREKRKLQAFRLKNLEFVMKHEEKELRRHVECMNQMTAYEEKQQLQLELQKQQQRQRQLQLEQKQQEREQRGILNDAGGGIGSKEQRHAERARKRQHLDGSTKKATVGHHGAPKQTFRTSLYLTNLPTDGSTTERTLQSLFCLYGRLDRVTMYRHRSTGELKGDGLIVFGRDAAEEYQTKNADGVDLVEAVCTQMNGAELPCGAVIGVQPASDDYKKAPNKVENTQQTASNGAANASAGTKLDSATEANGPKEEVSVEKAANDDEDLDDFFASLE